MADAVNAVAKLFHPIDTMVQENNLSILGTEEVFPYLPIRLDFLYFSFICLSMLVCNFKFPTQREIETIATSTADFSADLQVERSVICFVSPRMWCGLIRFLLFTDWIF